MKLQDMEKYLLFFLFIFDIIPFIENRQMRESLFIKGIEI